MRQSTTEVEFSRHSICGTLIALGDAQGAAARLEEGLAMSRKIDKDPTYEQAATLQYIGRLHRNRRDQ